MPSALYDSLSNFFYSYPLCVIPYMQYSNGKKCKKKPYSPVDIEINILNSKSSVPDKGSNVSLVGCGEVAVVNLSV